jgi:hypothetical protein
MSTIVKSGDISIKGVGEESNISLKSIVSVAATKISWNNKAAMPGQFNVISHVPPRDAKTSSGSTYLSHPVRRREKP